MTGSVGLKFFSYLRADALAHHLKSPPKSFVQRILPLSPTRRGFCRHKIRKSNDMRILQKRGEGVPPALPHDIHRSQGVRMELFRN